MESAWCTNCKANVSLQHAARELPCPSCTSTSYMVICFEGQASIEECDAKAEQFMRYGKWKQAALEYQTCSDMEPSEMNLRMANLEWRKDCSKHIHTLIVENGGKLSVADLRQYLLDNYDEYVTRWILQEYREILLVPNGTNYVVQWRD